MKKIIPLFIVALLISSCAKKEETKLEAYNAEAYAFPLEAAWELNASTIVKGFVQKEENGQFTHKLSYSLDIERPDSTIVKGILADVVENTAEEKLPDAKIEAQALLDSTFVPGVYIIYFNIMDEYGGQETQSSKELALPAL